jgi:hypothetical protein
MIIYAVAPHQPARGIMWTRRLLQGLVLRQHQRHAR